jgi:WD40 repeat protein
LHGDWLFCCSADKNVYLSSIKERKLVHTLSGHADWVYALAFDSAQGRLASGGFDARVRLWSVDGAKFVSSFQSLPLPMGTR